MKFYILLFANQELYEFLCHVLVVFKILMIERQSLQLAVGFEGTNSQTRTKKHYATLLSLQQVGPLFDFINPQFKTGFMIVVYYFIMLSGFKVLFES
ncbi:hypothetical protein Peur_065860 [Populus x canadensis]